MERFRVALVFMADGFGWGSGNIVGDWGGRHPMVNGNGVRTVPAHVDMPENIAAATNIVFGGISGYLAWVSYDRSANARFNFEN